MLVYVSMCVRVCLCLTLSGGECYKKLEDRESIIIIKLVLLMFLLAYGFLAYLCVSL